MAVVTFRFLGVFTIFALAFGTPLLRAAKCDFVVLEVYPELQPQFGTFTIARSCSFCDLSNLAQKAYFGRTLESVNVPVLSRSWAFAQSILYDYGTDWQFENPELIRSACARNQNNRKNVEPNLIWLADSRIVRRIRRPTFHIDLVSLIDEFALTER